VKRLLIAVVACAGILISTTAVTSAAPTAPSALTVSPAIVELSANKGQSSLVFTLSVTNDSPNKVSVISRVDDFTALNSTGSAQFLNNTTRTATAHGLAHWMTPNIPTFDLEAHATRAVSVAIDGLPVMAPGGHYGAVIFGVVPSADSSQANVVGSDAAVSSLVFLTTDTPGKKVVSLLTPDLSPIQLALPSSVDLIFANTGDVQATPHGTVTMSDPFHHEVAREMLNVDSGQVLPGTSRLYQIMFGSASQLRWPGLYRLAVAYRADGQAEGSSYEQTFLYIPSVLLILGGALLAAGLLFVLRRFIPGNLYRLKR